MIRLDGVTFAYPHAPATALGGVDLAVADGDLLCVFGTTGSGKSTLLRAMSGLVPHHSGGRFRGRVRVDGRDVTGSPPRDLAGTVGFVPQDPESHATARDVLPELAFTMENLGVEPVRMRKRIEEVLDQLGIGHLRDRRLDTLSGGERQRVAIAAVLAAQPRVLVCDEPTSALDPGSAEDVLSALVRLRDELGLTIVVAEHRIERVAAFADRAAHLAGDGSAIDAGPTRDVFARAPFAPPVTMLGRRLGWEPVPLTVREGRSFARRLGAVPPSRTARPPGAEAVVADHLHVRLDARDVLTGVDLEVRRGTITALVGRNGSGKTTLLRTLAGLVAPTRGSVRGRGDLEHLSPRAWARRVAYVPQRADALLYRDTVRDEITAACSDPADRDVWLDALGLLELADVHPWTLSAGNRLWCALGTAFARRPDVLLLDEPTRGLDPPGKERLAAMLRREADRGAAVLLVTHDVELVARACDRVAMLAAGRIVAEGTTAQVLGESVLFSSQTSKVMDDARFLVPEDVVA